MHRERLRNTISKHRQTTRKKREYAMPLKIQPSPQTTPGIATHHLVGRLTRIYAESKVSEVFYLFMEATRLWEGSVARRKEWRWAEDGEEGVEKGQG